MIYCDTICIVSPKNIPKQGSTYLKEALKSTMSNRHRNMFLIKLAYWFGIGADTLWAIGLISPKVFGLLTGQPGFNPDLQLRLIMGIGCSLMTGWTILLLWAVKEPVERRFIILLTAFPVVFGLSIVALIGYLEGNATNQWILIKNSILYISMVTSFLLANSIAKENKGGV